MPRRQPGHQRHSAEERGLLRGMGPWCAAVAVRHPERPSGNPRRRAWRDHPGRAHPQVRVCAQHRHHGQLLHDEWLQSAGNDQGRHRCRRAARRDPLTLHRPRRHHRNQRLDQRPVLQHLGRAEARQANVLPDAHSRGHGRNGAAVRLSRVESGQFHPSFRHEPELRGEGRDHQRLCRREQRQELPCAVSFVPEGCRLRPGCRDSRRADVGTACPDDPLRDAADVCHACGDPGPAQHGAGKPSWYRQGRAVLPEVTAELKPGCRQHGAGLRRRPGPLQPAPA